MSDIKNIRIGDRTPDKIYRCINQEPVEIKRIYRIIGNRPVIVWDIGSPEPPPAVNEFVLITPTVESGGKYYVVIPALETTNNRRRGTIEWGDGSETVFWTDALYNHEYTESGAKTVKIYAPIEYLYNSSAVGVFYQAQFDYIRFPDSLKILGALAFNVCYRISEIDFNNVEEIQSRAFYNSMVYFPYEPYNHYVDIELSNVKYIRSQAFYGSPALQKAHISDKIETIEANAFYNCSHLTEITIDKPYNSISGAPWGATKANITWRG